MGACGSRPDDEVIQPFQQIDFDTSQTFAIPDVLELKDKITLNIQYLKCSIYDAEERERSKKLYNTVNTAVDEDGHVEWNHDETEILVTPANITIDELLPKMKLKIKEDGRIIRRGDKIAVVDAANTSFELGEENKKNKESQEKEEKEENETKEQITDEGNSLQAHFTADYKNLVLVDKTTQWTRTFHRPKDIKDTRIIESDDRFELHLGLSDWVAYSTKTFEETKECIVPVEVHLILEDGQTDIVQRICSELKSIKDDATNQKSQDLVQQKAPQAGVSNDNTINAGDQQRNNTTIMQAASASVSQSNAQEQKTKISALMASLVKDIRQNTEKFKITQPAGIEIWGSKDNKKDPIHTFSTGDEITIDHKLSIGSWRRVVEPVEGWIEATDKDMSRNDDEEDEFVEIKDEDLCATKIITDVEIKLRDGKTTSGYTAYFYNEYFSVAREASDLGFKSRSVHEVVFRPDDECTFNMKVEMGNVEAIIFNNGGKAIRELTDKWDCGIGSYF